MIKKVSNVFYRISKLYSKAIMKNIGLFIFIGLIQIIFGDGGWLENQNLYTIFSVTNKYIIPICLAYTISNELSDCSGGIFAILGVTGFLFSNSKLEITASIVIGTLCGMIWNKLISKIIKKIDIWIELLGKNLVLSISGIAVSAFSFYILSPILASVSEVFYELINFFISHKLIFLLSIVIEPAKILFLNNSINYCVIIPLAMTQTSYYGSSVLFLIEANPGPGLGILLSLFAMNKKNRREYGTAGFVHALGGIHEMYFPYVYKNHILIIPLIIGGMVGNLWFNIFDIGLSGPSAPGSIFIIMLLVSKNKIIMAVLGIIISTLVSGIISTIVLRKDTNKNILNKEIYNNKKVINMTLEVVKIGFICDGGIGSSAIGAAIFRRILKDKKILNIEVSHYAVDMIPDYVNILVCQKSFYNTLKNHVKEEKQIITVESFIATNELENITKNLYV